MPPIQNDQGVFKDSNPDQEAGEFVAFLTKFFRVPFLKNEKDCATVRITGGRIRFRNVPDKGSKDDCQKYIDY